MSTNALRPAQGATSERSESSGVASSERSDSRQRGKLRASFRTGIITVTGSSREGSVACDITPADFASITSVPGSKDVTMLAEVPLWLNAVRLSFSAH